MNIIIGSDHEGYAMKKILSDHFLVRKYSLLDVGCFEPVACDYPDIVESLAEEMAEHKDAVGVLLSFTAIGLSINANKHQGLRAVSPHNEFETLRGRQYYNANVICLGTSITQDDLAIRLVECFVRNKFFSDDPDHLRNFNRVNELDTIR